MRPNPLYSRTVGCEDYFPIYQALEQARLTVGIHEGTFSLLPTAGHDRVKDQAGHHVVCHPFEQILAFLSLYQAEVFEKFPKLNFLFLECGTLWVPYWIERIDAERGEYRNCKIACAPVMLVRPQLIGVGETAQIGLLSIAVMTCDGSQNAANDGSPGAERSTPATQIWGVPEAGRIRP